MDTCRECQQPLQVNDHFCSFCYATVESEDGLLPSETSISSSDRDHGIKERDRVRFVRGPNLHEPRVITDQGDEILFLKKSPLNMIHDIVKKTWIGVVMALGIPLISPQYGVFSLSLLSFMGVLSLVYFGIAFFREELRIEGEHYRLKGPFRKKEGQLREFRAVKVIKSRNRNNSVSVHSIYLTFERGGKFKVAQFCSGFWGADGHTEAVSLGQCLKHRLGLSYFYEDRTAGFFDW